jgi:hypothetical protein
MNQTGIDIQHSLVNLHLVHTKNGIDSLAFQDNKTGQKDTPNKLEWNFIDHLIGNHSTSRSANRIRHLCSTESKLTLLSTC